MNLGLLRRNESTGRICRRNAGDKTLSEEEGGPEEEDSKGMWGGGAGEKEVKAKDKRMLETNEC